MYPGGLPRAPEVRGKVAHPPHDPPPACLRGYPVLLPFPAQRASDARGVGRGRGAQALSPFPIIRRFLSPPSAPPPLSSSPGRVFWRKARTIPGKPPVPLAGPCLLLGGRGREKLLSIRRGAERGAFPCAGTARALPALSLLALGRWSQSLLLRPLAAPAGAQPWCHPHTLAVSPPNPATSPPRVPP